MKSIKNLVAEFEAQPQATTSEDLPRHKLLSLYKQFRGIRGSLKVEIVKKVDLQQCINRESVSLRKSGAIQNTTMAFEKTSGSALPS